MSIIKLIGYGFDTLILNVRYSDSKGQPIKQELDEKLQEESAAGSSVNRLKEYDNA